jgi:hypothetical protein
MTTAQSELAEARSKHSALLTKRQRLVEQTAAISDAALAESSSRIAAIEARIADEQGRAAARAACGSLGEFRRLGARFDALLEEFVATHASMKALAQDLNIATGQPHMRLFAEMVKRSFLSAVCLDRDLVIEHVAPGSRRNMTAATESWAKSVEQVASGEVSK